MLAVVHYQCREAALSLARHPSGRRIWHSACNDEHCVKNRCNVSGALMVTMHLAWNRAPIPVIEAGSSSQADPGSFCRATLGFSEADSLAGPCSSRSPQHVIVLRE